MKEKHTAAGLVCVVESLRRESLAGTLIVGLSKERQASAPTGRDSLGTAENTQGRKQGKKKPSKPTHLEYC